MGKLDGKVAIVTGGGYGIGRGIALRFAGEGADVVIADVNLSRAEETAGMVRERGRSALAILADVARADDVQALVAKTVGQLGQVNILVNNAGIDRSYPFLEFPEEEWDRTLGVNLKGPFLCTQAAAREMVRAGQGGRVVNITSVHARRPYAGSSAYDASKAGLEHLTHTMALELAPHRITVNAVAPGFTETGINEKLRAQPGWESQYLPRIPLGRTGKPLDIAEAALFLVSPEAEYITGTTLFVDGGWLLR